MPARLASADRRPLLVEAALRVIARDGLPRATTRAIVAEAGMSLASFHYAFDSRDELMREVITHVVTAEAAAAFATLRPGDDLRSSLRGGLRAFLDYLVLHPQSELALQELLVYALRTPGLEPLAREQYAGYRAAVVSLLTDAAAAAGVDWSLPVDEIARLVVTVTDGVTLAWLADRDTLAARRVLDSAADVLARLATSPIGAHR